MTIAIVYSVDEGTKIIRVVSVWSHYKYSDRTSFRESDRTSPEKAIALHQRKRSPFQISSQQNDHPPIISDGISLLNEELG